MHSKKMPKIKSCFVEKKEFEFFGQFAVSFFLSFLHLPAVCRNRNDDADAERRLRWQRQKKIVAEIQLFYIF